MWKPLAKWHIQPFGMFQQTRKRKKPLCKLLISSLLSQTIGFRVCLHRGLWNIVCQRYGVILRMSIRSETLDPRNWIVIVPLKCIYSIV